MRRPVNFLLLVAVAALVSAMMSSGPAMAKKSRPATDAPADSSSPASNADVAKAEAAATVALANVKLARMALSDDAELAPVKDTLGPIYDRQEAATNDGLQRLKVASDARSKAAALAELDSAGAESAKFFKRNPDVKEKVTRRVTIMNEEVGQIAKSPDKYVRVLSRCGVGGEALSRARSIVTDAAARSGGKAEGDSLDVCLNARSQVHQLLSPTQAKSLDTAYGGK